MTAARRLLYATAAVALVAGIGACSSGNDEGACGPIRREALDPSYLVHVLGDDVAVDYTSDPPTSGPHQPGPPVEGALDDAITQPIQVGILERGDVLLQHDPDLGEDDLAVLRDLAGERVVVAPNPDLPDPIVATAWVYKRTCSAVDATALQEFIDERAGNGPEG